MTRLPVVLYPLGGSIWADASYELPRRSSGVTIMVLDRTILLPEDESRWTLSEGNIILWSGSIVGVGVRVGGSSLLGWASAMVRSTGARARARVRAQA